MSENNKDFLDDENIEIKKEKKRHALEDFFNVEENSTEIEKVEVEYPIEKIEEYDKKDAEIEEQIQKIFNSALTGYYSLEQILDGVEPKYRARLAEVALAYLNTGLNAANSKIKQKELKDKLILREKTTSKNPNQKTTNNIIISDRNEMLRKIMEKENDPIDISSEKEKKDE